jgi:hypothetical protein
MKQSQQSISFIFLILVCFYQNSRKKIVKNKKMAILHNITQKASKMKDVSGVLAAAT